MPFVSVPANTWTTALTSATVRTAVQNRGPVMAFFTTEATDGNTASDAGIAVPPERPVVYEEGSTVQVYSTIAGRVFVSALGV